MPTKLRVEDLLATWTPGKVNRHPQAALCPSDGKDLTRIGITDIVYSFEPCTCGTPDFDHLVEQLWHRTCYKPTDRG